MEGYRPADKFEKYLVPKPRSFQGRRVVPIEWEGKETLAPCSLWIAGRSAKDAEEILFDVIASPGPMDSKGASAAAKKAGGGIKWIEPVALDEVAFRPNDFHFNRQWAIEAIRAPEGWGRHTGNPERCYWRSSTPVSRCATGDCAIPTFPMKPAS